MQKKISQYSPAENNFLWWFSSWWWILMLMIQEKQVLLLETLAAWKEKISFTYVIVKTAFSQNNNSAPKAKIPIRSDLIRNPIRNPIQILLTALLPYREKLQIQIIIKPTCNNYVKNIKTCIYWLYKLLFTIRIGQTPEIQD